MYFLIPPQDKKNKNQNYPNQSFITAHNIEGIFLQKKSLEKLSASLRQPEEISSASATVAWCNDNPRHDQNLNEQLVLLQQAAEVEGRSFGRNALKTQPGKLSDDGGFVQRLGVPAEQLQTGSAAGPVHSAGCQIPLHLLAHGDAPCAADQFQAGRGAPHPGHSTGESS